MQEETVSSPRDNFVGEILVNAGVLNSSQLNDALIVVATKSDSLLDYLLGEKIVTEIQARGAIAARMGLSFMETIRPDEVAPHLIENLPIVFAKNNRVLPLQETVTGVRVACADPFDLGALDAVQAILGRPVESVVAPGEVIVEAINSVYERSGKDEDLGGTGAAEEEELTDLIDAEDEAPIIRWVNNLFFEAVRRRASPKAPHRPKTPR